MVNIKPSQIVLFISILIASSCTTTTATPPPATETSIPLVTATPSGDLPDMPDKPVPLDVPFNGCPPEGNGGDSEQNLLKNRSDEGNYVPVNFDAVASLTWPVDIQQKERKNWSPQDKAAITKYEGIPVMVEGYLAGAKESGAESANCGKTASNMVDWHVWFVKSSGDGREVSIVVEPTPRSRAGHQWMIVKLKPFIDEQTPVRISGWLFFDPEHPDQIGLTRGTLWEVHPVMQIEVWQNGQWVPLDDT